MIKRTIITALAVVAMVGCQKENNVEEITRHWLCNLTLTTLQLV